MKKRKVENRNQNKGNESVTKNKQPKHSPYYVCRDFYSDNGRGMASPHERQIMKMVLSKRKLISKGEL